MVEETGPLAQAVAAAVAAAVAGTTGPAAELALTYARAIDGDGDQLGDLGPKLLAALDALLLTPRSRKKAVNDDQPTSPLDELRSRRAARQRGAAPVDTTAP